MISASEISQVEKSAKREVEVALLAIALRIGFRRVRLRCMGVDVEGSLQAWERRRLAMLDFDKLYA